LIIFLFLKYRLFRNNFFSGSKPKPAKTGNLSHENVVGTKGKYRVRVVNSAGCPAITSRKKPRIAEKAYDLLTRSPTVTG